MATAQINVYIDPDGRVYPAGSDTPVPERAVAAIQFARADLTDGDIIIDTYGEPYQIRPVDDPEVLGYPTLGAWSLDGKSYRMTRSLKEPIIRIYHNGEPRNDWIS